MRRRKIERSWSRRLLRIALLLADGGGAFHKMACCGAC